MKKDTSIGMQELINQGFLERSITAMFKLIWHQTRPRKPAMLLWQILNRGIVIGDWLSWKVRGAKHGCPLCGFSIEKTAHLFWECKLVKELWQKFNALSPVYNVPKIASSGMLC